MLWYSLEAPLRGASNEYPQHIFSWRNKKNIFLICPFSKSYVILYSKKFLMPKLIFYSLVFCSTGLEYLLSAGNRLSRRDLTNAVRHPRTLHQEFWVGDNTLYAE